MKSTHKPLGTPPPSAEEVHAQLKKSAEEAEVEAFLAQKDAARKAARRAVRAKVKNNILVPVLVVATAVMTAMSILFVGLSIETYVNNGTTFAYLGFGYLSAAWIIGVPTVVIVLKLRSMHAEALERELKKLSSPKSYTDSLLEQLNQLTPKPSTWTGTGTGVTHTHNPTYTYKWNDSAIKYDNITGLDSNQITISGDTRKALQTQFPKAFKNSTEGDQ